MSGLLKILALPMFPTFVIVAARNVLPAVRRLPVPQQISRYRFDVPTVTFGPRDFGM